MVRGVERGDGVLPFGWDLGYVRHWPSHPALRIFGLMIQRTQCASLQPPNSLISRLFLVRATHLTASAVQVRRIAAVFRRPVV